MRDLNGNGRIDNITEMFGGASSGFAQLAALDGYHDGRIDAGDNGLADFNGDGVIDANDTVGALQVWRDLDDDIATMIEECAWRCSALRRSRYSHPAVRSPETISQLKQSTDPNTS